MNKKDHPLYQRWSGIRARCNNKNHIAYPRYGGVGIKVCSRWDDFWCFVEDMGLPPSPDHTVDREDSGGDYGPGNCRWATPAEQNRNTKRNIWVEIDGVRLVVRDWEHRNGVGRGAYQRRIDLGWPHILAVTLPLRPGVKRKDRESTSSR